MKLLTLIFTFVFCAPLYAYIGPGAGVSAIGTAIIFVLVLLLLIAGFLWYPLKKLMAKRKQKDGANDEDDRSDSDKARGL